MRLTELLIFGVLAVSGCKKAQPINMASTTQTIVIKNINNKADTVLADTVTYLALGDSYTIGEFVTQQESYPYQLAAQLRSGKLKMGTPQIIARTGWTTGDLINAVSTANLNPKYSFVTLLIGVNNQYQGLDPVAYRKDFDLLVNTAILLAKGGAKHVFVLSIPDYSVTPFAQGSDLNKIKTELANYNSINAAESARMNVNYTDITPISLQAATDASLLAGDGLHPSGKMYTLWVQKLLPQVLAGSK